MKTAKFSKPLTIALAPEVYDQIKTITDNRQISMAEWMRAAVDMALTTNQQKEDNM